MMEYTLLAFSIVEADPELLAWRPVVPAVVDANTPVRYFAVQDSVVALFQRAA